MKMPDCCIPDCYDPIYQAEQLEREADRRRVRFRRCDLCRCTIGPGNVYRECFGGLVCQNCFEELSSNAYLQEEYYD